MSLTTDFSDIAPFDDSLFSSKMASLVKEPGFEHAVRFVMPDADYSDFAKSLLSIHDKETFQRQVMWPFLEKLCHDTTDGISSAGLENIGLGNAYTFITNHRDIVLDASFLNLCFLRQGLPTSEVAIGDNLLIFDWITDLVKLNKSFIVRRGLRLTKAYEASKHLSAYIHHAISEKHQSVWIAQREGRAKDSNDMTQEAVVKMLGIAGGRSLINNIADLNIVPVAISYEYDPNDYLKAREFLLRKLDPDFKKSQHDDLFSMETGLLGYKGHIHFQVGQCINPLLREINPEADRQEIARTICRFIDCEIHSGYKIYPINYIAHDLLHGSKEHDLQYSPDEMANFQTYIEHQLDKVSIPGTDISELDRNYMREMMLTMYANPLKNKTAAKSKCASL
ncbi:MAG: hypothetical protein NC342_03355 [Pseudoflavonifractor sp.]|nr:acyltransferase [Alloprevotella sp.]MCM1116552.1 hypothetical protein [Pseudoflavonifractor sp.]